VGKIAQETEVAVLIGKGPMAGAGCGLVLCPSCFALAGGNGYADAKPKRGNNSDGA
jgi:hypothetical protein